MAIAFLIGRVVFALYWLDNARNHLLHAEQMAGYAGSKGVPSPKAAVLGSGVLLVIGGASILLGWYPTIGIAAVVLFLLGVTFKMHAYWAENDPAAAQHGRIQFMKNLALLGAALMLLAIPEPWSFSVGNWNW